MSVISQLFRKFGRGARPNSFVFHDRKLVLMLIAKAANSSVKSAVLNAVGYRHEDDNPHRLAKALYPVPSKARALQLKRRGYTVVTVVRDPHERVTSCWADKIAGPGGNVHPPIQKVYGRRVWHNMPLDEWVRFVCAIPDRRSGIHFRSMAYDLIARSGELIPGHVFRVEEKGWWGALRATLIERCDLDIGSERRRNTSLAEAPQLSEGSRRLIAQRYALDLQRFNYC